MIHSRPNVRGRERLWLFGGENMILKRTPYLL